jgi:DedD protein
MDKALKQRLVGASVLIILAVIVLPMLLSGRSDRLKQESRQIELPPKPDELSIETRRFPVGVPPRPALATAREAVEVAATQNEQQAQTGSKEPPSAGVASPDSIPEVGAAETQATDTAAEEVLTAKAGPAQTGTMVASPEQAPEVASITADAVPENALDLTATETADENAPRYLVQVSSFSTEKNAQDLADLLKKDRLPVLMDTVDRSTGRMYRVSVGPYAKRAEADALVASLSNKMTDLTPRVLDLMPDESAPVSTPSDPLVRWVVQVGSFSSSKKAETLTAELRQAGYSAFSEKVSSATATVYKVRIGPELERDKAIALKRKVKAEQGLDAFVTTQE